MGTVMPLVAMLSFLAQLIIIAAIQIYTENTQNGKMKMEIPCVVANKIICLCNLVRKNQKYCHKLL